MLDVPLQEICRLYKRYVDAGVELVGGASSSCTVGI